MYKTLSSILSANKNDWMYSPSQDCYYRISDLQDEKQLLIEIAKDNCIIDYPKYYKSIYFYHLCESELDFITKRLQTSHDYDLFIMLKDPIAQFGNVHEYFTEDVKIDHANSFFKKDGIRFYDAEHIIALNTQRSIDYAERVLRSRFPLGESTILNSDAKLCYHYARGIGERFLLGESKIAEDSWWSYLYASDVIKGRFELGESAMSLDARCAYLYATEVIQDRFELGESAISAEHPYSVNYDNFLLKLRKKKYNNPKSEWQKDGF